jgi:hypothetical protein
MPAVPQQPGLVKPTQVPGDFFRQPIQGKVGPGQENEAQRRPYGTDAAVLKKSGLNPGSM